MAKWSGTTKWSRRARKKNIDRHPQSDIYKNLIRNFGKTLAVYRKLHLFHRKAAADFLFSVYIIENNNSYTDYEEKELKTCIEKLLNIKNFLFEVNDSANWYRDWSRGNPYGMQDYKKYLEIQKEKIK